MSRLYDRLIMALALLAGVMVTFVFGLIIVDVGMRTLGMKPPLFTSAVSEYSLLYMTMFAAPWLVRERGHIRIDSFIYFLPKRATFLLERLIILLCAALCLVAVWYSAKFAIQFWQRGTIDIRSIEVPRSLLFVPMILGFALCAVEFLRMVLRAEPLGSPSEEAADAPFEGEI